MRMQLLPGSLFPFPKRARTRLAILVIRYSAGTSSLHSGHACAIYHNVTMGLSFAVALERSSQYRNYYRAESF